MSEKSTTPGPGDLVRGFLESTDRGEVGESLRFYAADAVFDMSPVGLGVYEGPEAIRRFYEDWMRAYDASHILVEKVLELNGGIVLAVFRQDARPKGSHHRVRVRTTWVYEWVAGRVVRVTNYPPLDEGRTAAERLAEERD
jgi:ketosteroid isomerase-like protein